MFSSIPGFYPLDASSTLSPLGTTKNVSCHCQRSPGWQNRPLLGITGLKDLSTLLYVEMLEN